MMTQNTTADARRSRLALRLVARGILGMTAIDAMLFGLAGRVNWRAAWVLSVLLAAYIAAGMMWFLRKDPDLLEERITRASNVPTWDRLLRKMYGISLVALLATAAVDAGRFRWSQMPIGAQFVGAVGLLASFAVIWWCTASNHYLSSEFRIQADRGHRVVRNGPYRFVRHPMYTSLIVLMSSMALLLGSWLALAPALLIAALLVNAHLVRRSDAERPAARLSGVRAGRHASSRARHLVKQDRPPLRRLVERPVREVDAQVTSGRA